MSESGALPLVEIQSVNWSLTDETKLSLRSEARRDAIANAYMKACEVREEPPYRGQSSLTLIYVLP